MKVAVMSGAGNTFGVLDVRGETLDLSDFARKLCNTLNVDGLLALDHGENADFRLHFYNRDGSRGEMCGNGARCVCKFAYDNGIAGESMTVQTDAGLVRGWRLDEDTYRIQLNNPSVIKIRPHSCTYYVELGEPGVPHCVSQQLDLEFAWREELRPDFLHFRHLKDFPKGANVNIFAMVGENRARVITFERGVEDFTLACGTGSASIAVVLWKKGQLPGGVLEVENMGGLLTVTVVGVDGQVQELYLEGPAETWETIEL